MSSLILLTLLVVAAVVATRAVRGVQWKTLQPGLDFTMIHGEPYCRRGSAEIAVLRVDPRRLRLRVRHYSSESSEDPLSLLEWRRRSDALAVFNAGQYYPDFSYMGLLVSDGEVISKRGHPEFQAALVAERASGQGGAHVIDLADQSIDELTPAWREVAQSFMLFDRKGRLRVRKSDRVANRTIVGEDRHGRLFVITTEGGYKLWELAGMLRASALGMTHAMCMDGGAEAKLCIRTARFKYASFGPWDGRATTTVPGADVPLPAVVTISPR